MHINGSFSNKDHLAHPPALHSTPVSPLSDNTGPPASGPLQQVVGSPIGTGRRKSTPAALDMALRTAEGKQAVEDLLKQSKKMAFPSYFVGQKVQPQPEAPRPAGQTSGRFTAKHIMGMSSKVPTIAEHPVEPPPAEQESRPRAPAAMLPEASRSQKRSALDSVSSLPAARGDEHQQQHKQQLHEPSPVHSSAKDGTLPTPAAAAEEVPPPASKRNKLLHISPSVPAAMNRKFWSLSDYKIMRKMYTGYASTVYQVRAHRPASRGWGNVVLASHTRLTVRRVGCAGHVHQVTRDGCAQGVPHGEPV